MAYVDCPRCGGEEAALVEVLTEYEWDTNAGGAPELSELECDCRIEDLSANEIDKAIEDAIKKYPLHHLHWADGRV